MSDHSLIEWTDATWNPITGCAVVSPGCTNCYTMAQAARIARMQPASHYVGATQDVNGKPVWTGKIALAPDHIMTRPLHWRRPRRVFVNSMGDLFHPSVPDAWIDRVFAVMALAPQHTFQVLTKRADRMRAYLNSRSAPDERGQPAEDIRIQLTAWLSTPSWREKHPAHAAITPRGRFCAAIAWPLPNVWLGVSAEDQARADARIPDLLATPAAIRFVSAEPLLGPIRLDRLTVSGDAETNALASPRWEDEIENWRGTSDTWKEDFLDWYDLSEFPAAGPMHATLDVVIVGGESGPNARPMHPDWVRSLRDQCAAAGTGFFFKQWGEWAVEVDRERDDPDWRLDYSARWAETFRVRWLNLAGGCGFHGERFHVMRRVGKRTAGRLLDGREHNTLPESPR